MLHDVGKVGISDSILKKPGRLNDEEYDTIGGLILQELGRMPRRGEAVQIGGLELKVTRADRRRIETLRVTSPRDLDIRPADGG